jgi:hypothetical protein
MANRTLTSIDGVVLGFCRQVRRLQETALRIRGQEAECVLDTLFVRASDKISRLPSCTELGQTYISNDLPS